MAITLFFLAVATLIAASAIGEFMNQVKPKHSTGLGYPILVMVAVLATFGLGAGLAVILVLYGRGV